MSKHTSLFKHLNDTAITQILAFIGGFYDAVGYLLIQEVFVASITGDMVAAFSSIASPHGVALRTGIFLCFTVAGIVTSTLALHMKQIQKQSTKRVVLVLFTIELAMSIINTVLGIVHSNSIIGSTNMDDFNVILVGSLMGATMGAHCVAARESIPNCPPTTVMTSTLINFAFAFTNASSYFLARSSIYCCVAKPDSAKSKPIAGSEEQQQLGFVDTNDDGYELLTKQYQEAVNKLKVISLPLFFFIVGVVVGAVLTHVVHFWSLCVPSALVLFIIFEVAMKKVDGRTTSVVALTSTLLQRK